jgi:DNA-binding SARP family transcriptional activator
LLLALLLKAGRSVSLQRLVGDVWDDEPPPHALDDLYVLVSRLRSVLGRKTIETHERSYKLVVDREAVDARRFERLARRGRKRLEEGSHDEAVAVLVEALSLWRGPPFGELAEHGFLQADAARLDGLRLAALEDRIEAELRMGRHTHLGSELERLVRQHPLRERLWAQLMEAHYGAGQQSAALAAYRRAHASLVAQAGLDPSPLLRRLQQQMLAHDPSLGGADHVADGSRYPLGVRKLATVVCAQPSVAETADVEQAVAASTQLVAAVSGVLVRHGATVETGQDGRVTATFGVARMREDDPLRALEAARAAETAAPGPVQIGIATGDVLVDALGSWSGRVTRVAQLLADGSTPGKIALCSLTKQLVSSRDGRDALFVGRGEQVAQIRSALAAVRSRGSGTIVTVLGSAGAGKSRLARELKGALPNVVTVNVRCERNEPVYAPLVRITGALDIASALSGCRERDEIERALAAAADDQAPAPAAETRWAFREVLARAGSTQPVLLVIDDLHNAGELFLDLLEDLPDFLRTSRVLVVCFARGELLEDRPSWGAGRPNMTTITLPPLSKAEADELARALAADVSDSERRSVVDAAEGNPLFIEQLLAMREDGGVPTTPPQAIRAVIAARLDRLSSSELAVLQAASVLGSAFDVSRLRLIAARGADLDALIADLVRKELLRGNATDISFQHQLIRDVTYASLPHAARASLHEHAVDVLQDDSAAAFHLEQSYRHRLAAGEAADGLGDLAQRASDRLSDAAYHAALNGDYGSAADLLDRAAEPLPQLSRRRALLRMRLVLFLRADSRASSVLDEALEIAEAMEDRTLIGFADAWRAHARLWLDPTFTTERYARDVERARASMGGDMPELGAHAEVLAGVGELLSGRYASAEAMFRAAAGAMRRSDLLIWEVAARNLACAWAWGPRPVSYARRACARLSGPGTPFRTRRLRATALRETAACDAMAGRFDDARRLALEAGEILNQLGLESGRALAAEVLATAAYLAGDLETAEREAAEGVAVIRGLAEGPYFWLSTLASFHARLLCLLGRFEDAEEVLAITVDAPPRDIAATIRADAVRARLALERGQAEEAVAFARQAARLSSQTDMLDVIGHTYEDLADVLEGAGDTTAALDALRTARTTFARKGHLRARERVHAESARSRS